MLATFCLGSLLFGFLGTASAQNSDSMLTTSPPHQQRDDSSHPAPPSSHPALPPSHPVLPPPPPPPPPPHKPEIHGKGGLNYAGSDGDHMKSKNILAMVLPLVVITLVLLLASAGIYYMTSRAKYGAFCCLRPHLNYQRQHNEPKEDSYREMTNLAAPPRSGIPPPDYTPCTLDPPVYQDALQDVVISMETNGSDAATQTTPTEVTVSKTIADSSSSDDAGSTDRLLH